MSADASAPVQFEAVGGHKSSIFYGESTRDGRTTLQKKTTAWEILYYLAMELSKEAPAQPMASDSVRTKFIDAAGKLAAFAPQIFSLHFPEKYAPKAAELQPYVAQMGEWVVLEEGAPARALLAPLFHELFDGVEALQGFDDAYDSGIWGIGLVNETSGMQQPCVMDVKVGFIRHSPLTPEEKVERMMKKERNSLMRDTALRICGCRRYIREGTATELSCERYGKEIGYAVSDVAELSSCLKLFLSTSVAMADTVEEGKIVFHLAAINDVAAAERADMEKRIADIRADIRAVLHFFEETPQGIFLLQYMAFVSASVLVLYDAAASPASARLRFIDFARSTWRKFNFDEQTVGFVQGLKNLDAYLA